MPLRARRLATDLATDALIAIRVAHDDRLVAKPDVCHDVLRAADLDVPLVVVSSFGIVQ
ncbi:hypothetical protein ABZ793_24485 [Micromonospora sp. NPDC047465]|uniref:hypothetical protein n=1 Tax=Micromonospora sp. NPDC047465 TaxID=3154813 RepID=UPI00340A3991